jgi:hypothetical protein
MSEAMVTPAAAGTAVEAEALIAHFSQVMDALLDIVRQETDLVRAGRLGQAALLAEPKTDLTRRYIADAMQIKVSHAQVAPERLAALHRQHDDFRALLQVNLTVLATAHAVSEGIVRGVSGELARKSAPQTYGASGRPSAPSASTIQPLAVSRSL